MELLRLHIITPEQAIDHPARYALTRSVGGDITVRVDIRTERLESGDSFLLCSDGLWSNVTASEITDALGRDPASACERLVKLALERGGDDNATAMAIRVREAGQRPEAPQGWRRLFS
jgi:protein phosphatase